MMNMLLYWLARDDISNLTKNNTYAIIIVAGICALCLDVLTPNMTAGITLSNFELATHAAGAASNNRFNQLFWVAMVFLASISILRDPKRYTQLLYNLWPVVALTAIAIFSVLWALDQGISFRRTMLMLFINISLSAGICYLRKIEQLYLILYRVCYIGMILNIVTLATGSFDPDGNFYGIHGQKNSLGAVALIAIFSGLTVRNIFGQLISKRGNTIYLIIWLSMLVISASKTSLALLIIAPIIVYIAQKTSNNLKIDIGWIILLSVIMLFLLFQFTTSLNNWNAKEFFTQFMADPSFTGRDYIWDFLIERIKERWLLGYGNGSFWGIGTDAPNVVYGQSYLQLLNQGHNGYLDLMAILGVSGLALYFLIIINYMNQSKLMEKSHSILFNTQWIIIVMSLIHNITESSIMRGSHAMWIIQLLVIVSAARFFMDRRLKG